MSKKLPGGVRRWAALLTSVALIAQLSSFAPPAIAAAPAPREIAELRSARGRIFDNGDGTYKYEAFSEAIHYQDTPGGGWKSIDSTLVRETNPTRQGWRNKANAFTASLPEAVGAEWVSIEATAGVVRYRPAVANAPLRGSVSVGATATVDPLKPKEALYKGAFGQGVDLEYVSTSDGLKETIVLDRYRGKNVFTFDLETGDLAPRFTGDGGVGLYSTESTVPVYLITPPVMEDSSANDGAEPATSYDVRYVVVPRGNAWQLSVVADDAWLAASERVWPVKIDPCIIYQPYGTFESNGYSMTGDAFVTSAYPSTNYGNSWSSGHAQLKVGYYPEAGENYTYVMPDINPLLQMNSYARVQVVSANLNMNCWWRYDHGTGPINYGAVANSWGEYSLTWNNQPYTAYGIGTGYVTEGQRTRFPITDATQSWINGATAHGIIFWAPAGGNVGHWTKFDAREGGAYPVFECCFSTRPTAQSVVQADGETPFAGAPTVQWAYSDLQYQDGYGTWHDFIKPLVRTEVQVKRAGASDSTITNGSIPGPGVATREWQQGAVPTPSGGWQDGTYATRLRVVTNVPELGMEVASDWTSWSTFSYRALANGSDGLGVEPYRAQDSAGGATVDLATGRLLLARTDFAATALGGSLGAGFVYDSSRATDAGAGPGWRVSMPSLGFDDQRAPNPGFEQWADAYHPTGWYSTDPSSQPGWSALARSGIYSLGLWRASGSYGGAQMVADAPITVVPGQFLDAAGWIRAWGLTSGVGGGAVLRIHYYDANDAWMSCATSQLYTEYIASEWRRIAVRGVVPVGATRARLSFDMLNSHGQVCLDDVTFRDGTMGLTDADGTSRTFAPLAGGAYQRDPLAGALALKRTNVAAGIKPVTQTGAVCAGASTDGNYAITGGTGYDAVTWNAGAAWLQYNLPEARVLSEARLYLWDGDLRSYTYALQYSQDGTTFYPVTYTDGTPANAVGRSWMTHRFTPVKAKSFRVVALGNTVNEGFHVAELELPVTTLSESPVAFDNADRITGIADTSGNLIKYSYDSDGDLLSSADSQGRRVDLNWSGEQLAGVDWTGVGSVSDAPAPKETGVVTYESVGDNFLVRRKADDGTYVTVATYTYIGGRITGVTDADGVTADVAYDSAGRVESITRGSESTPTVTAYDYSVANAVTITTSGGGQSLARRVEFSPALGCQVTKVTALDPAGPDPATVYTYDVWGHIATVTHPDGRVDSYTCDTHGNITATTVNSTSTDANLKLASTATYANDRVTSTTDPKGNVSRQLYDGTWRPISSTASVSSSGAEATVEESYDSYGNRTQGDVPGSTAANLLENGTFEKDPAVAGNGWAVPADVASRLSFSDTAVVSRPIHQLKNLTASAGVPRWVTSDPVSVTAGEAYQFSVWTRGAGVITLTELNAAGAVIRTFDLARLADRQNEELQRVSASYTPASGVSKVALELRADGTSTTAAFDNARFEKANAVGPDNLIDNDSFERLAGSAPEGWVGSGGAPLVLDAPVIAGGERVLHIGAPNAAWGPNWESAAMPVRAGEQFAFAVDLLCQNIALAADGSALVELTFFKDDACSWTTGNVLKETITDPTLLKGTTEWRRFSRAVTIPEDARQMKVRVILWHASGDLYADHLSMEPVAPRETYAYDATHTYRTSTTTLSGAVNGATFDSRGRVTSASHKADASAAASVETTRTYDAFGRLTGATTAPDSGLWITAAFTYTPAGRLKTVTDPLSHTTTLDYLEGRLAKVTSPTGATTAMTYDGLGRTESVSAPYRPGDAIRTLVSYAYDSLGRLGEATYHAEDGSASTTQTVTYDTLSRPASVAWSGEATGTLAYTYDALGRTTSLAATGPAGASTVSTTYDKASLPLTITLTALGMSATTTNTFAKSGQWQTTGATGTQVWSLTTGTDGKLRRTASPLASRTLDYDPALRTSAVRLDANGSFFAEETLLYDSYDRVTGSVVAAPAATHLQATDTYLYDAAGRMTSWSHEASGTLFATAYAFDAAGNLTGIDAPGTEGDTTFTSDDDNRLTTAVTGGVTTTYTHDNFGRRTHESSTEASSTYTWNSLGQLATVASTDATSTYEYGPSGMRERVTIASAEGTATTTSAWTGSRLTLERDSDGTTYRYLWGPDGLPLELVVTPEGGGNASYAYQCDRAGSVVALTDSSGTVVASYSYDPWGEVLSTGGSDAALAKRNPLRYRGYYYDAPTGLYYLPARYYDPATASFLSPDPAPPSAGDPLSLNRYAYCLGDPVNHSDASGAIMDSDGNGKLDNYDHNLASSKATKGNTSKFYKAKARGQYAQNTGDVQGAWAATLAIANMGQGWRLGSFDAPAQAAMQTVGDGTPFGRDNYNWMPSRPDDTTWMLGGVGALLDILTPLCGPAAVVPIAAGIVINGAYAVWHYQPLREQGDATWGDVFWTGAGAIPVIGTVPSVVTVVGYDFIHWAEPSN